MWEFHFQERVVLRLEDASVPLPCHEKLWECGSVDEWREGMKHQSG